MTKKQSTTVITSASAGDEFDLDIRINDLDPADPDRIHLDASVNDSCTFCCPDLPTNDCVQTLACSGLACQN